MKQVHLSDENHRWLRIRALDLKVRSIDKVVSSLIATERLRVEEDEQGEKDVAARNHRLARKSRVATKPKVRK